MIQKGNMAEVISGWGEHWLPFFFQGAGHSIFDIFPTVFLLRVVAEPISTWTYRVPLDQRSTRCLFRSTSHTRSARSLSSRLSTQFSLTLLDILPRVVYTILHSAPISEHKCMSLSKFEYHWRVVDVCLLFIVVQHARKTVSNVLVTLVILNYQYQHTIQCFSTTCTPSFVANVSIVTSFEWIVIWYVD